MFRNYLTVALRNIVRNKLYALINIGGLAIGLAACILILLFIRYELSYDEWIPDGQRIEKLELHIPIPGRDPLDIAQVPPALIPLLPDYFEGEIEASTRFSNLETVVGTQDKAFNESIKLVDATFFDVFDIPMVSGERDAITTSNTSMLISESMARKYFGDAPAEGQVLNVDLVNNPVDYKVAGVFKDVPQNSHMAFDFLVLLDTTRENWRRFETAFGPAFCQAGYAKFYPGADVRSVESRLRDFYVSVAPGPEGAVGDDQDYRKTRVLNFINVRDVHLYSDKIQQIKPIGDIRIVVNFAIVAVLILTIATINFANLATAQAIRRAKEVSMRKVMGASRRQLMVQFLGESVLTSLVALLAAFTLVEMLLPSFRDYLGVYIPYAMLDQPLQTLAIVGLTICFGLLGGAYPALFLSGFRPALLLGSSVASKKGSGAIRQALVIFQFAISIGLIIATSVVHDQMQLIQTMDLGFDKEHKLSLSGLTSDQVSPSEATLRQELLKVPGVRSAGLTTDPFPLVFYNDMPITVPSLSTEHSVDTDRIFIDNHFFGVFGIEPVAGRLYSDAYPGDTLTIPEDKTTPWTRSAVVTETFVKKAGFNSPDAAIGELLVVEDYGSDGQPLHANVVGVIPDLHARSLKERTGPMVFFASDQVLDIMVLDIRSSNLRATLEGIDEAWNRIVPNAPINRSFIDDDYQALYDNERRQGQVFAVFSVFAILVACLGLFGLATFAADQRVKEVGIRKVLGAGILDILKLLSWQFVKPVLWANVIAWPLAWYLMEGWLERFSQRVDLNVVLFVVAGLVALVIAWLTVGTQAYRVARSNPIRALRYE